MDRMVFDGKWVIGAFLVLSCVPLSESLLTPPSVQANVKATNFATPLSKRALKKHQTEFKQSIQSELDLKGLGKISNVGRPIPPELIKFRQKWAKNDAAVAPFLGSWSYNWIMHPYYFMTVLPSKTLGRVCIITTKKDLTETVPFEEVTTAPKFSIARVVKGQLLGTQMQSARSLLFPIPASHYLSYNTELLGMIKRNGVQNIYAAEGLPSVDPTWDSNIRQKLNAYGCISDQRLPN